MSPLIRGRSKGDRIYLSASSDIFRKFAIWRSDLNLLRKALVRVSTTFDERLDLALVSSASQGLL